VWARRGRAPRSALRAGLLFALFVAAAVVASGCGGSAAAEVGAYSGAWQRVVGGEPEPSFTLLVEQTGEGAELIFADASGVRAQGVATLEDGCLVLQVPADNGIVDGASVLKLSLGDGGQLVVDRVLGDGTTEPVWVYDRAASVAPAP
jgi:hypothetical protein